MASEEAEQAPAAAAAQAPEAHAAAQADDEAYRYVSYTVDPAQNPAAWPGPDRPTGLVVASKVDVHYVNVDAGSDFRGLRTGTNQDHHCVLRQVTKHVARGLYRLVSLSLGPYQCVVVISTARNRADLSAHQGFPWDLDEYGLDDVVLPGGKIDRGFE